MPVDPALVLSLIELAARSPSVGFSQPWRFVLVESPERREAIRASFVRANAEALSLYAGERRGLYAKLKLEGLERRAGADRRVCRRGRRSAGAGLGSHTMPETLRYSVVGAIQTLWLAARAHGLGVGWVSILEPGTVTTALEVPATWRSSLTCASAGRPRSTSTPSSSGTAGRSASIRRPLSCGVDHSAGAGRPAASARGFRVESRRMTT